jgi:TP901 family phage tail tape measure protein
VTERSIVAKLRAEVSQYLSGMKSAADATAKVGDSAERSQSKASGAFGKLSQLAKKNSADMDRVGNAAMVAGGAIVAGLGVGIKAFADFDQAMSAASAALPQAGAQMESLRQLAITLGKDTQFSATEAAQGVTELAKAGVEAGDIMGGGLKGALDLAAAGQLDVAEAAETAATAMTMFKLSGKDVPHIADLLAAGAGKAQGSVRDMGMALKQAGLVAAQTGLTIEETTGGLAAFASAGLVGSDAGTSFKSMLQRLNPQSQEAKKVMDELGISAYDSQGNFIGLANFAGKLRDSMKDLTPEARNAAMATIFGSDAVRAASVIYEQGAGGIQSWIDKVNDAGYAAEQARKLTDNWYGDLERLSGAVDTVFVQNGSAANDALRSLTQTVEGAVEAFGSLPGWVQQGALGLTGLTGVALLAGGAFLKVVTSGRELLDSLDAIHARGGKAEAALTGAGKAAAIAAKSMAGLALAGALSSTTGENTRGVNQLTKELLGSADAVKTLNKMFADGSQLGGTYNGALHSVGDALDAAFNPGVAQNIDNIGGSILSFLGGRNSSDIARSRDQFKELGESLASLVQSGSGDRAASIFNQIAAEAKKSGYSVDDLMKLMPPYAEALAAADVQGQTTAGTLNQIADEARGAQVDISALSEAIKGFGGAALNAEAAESAFQASIDDAAASIEKNGATLDLNTEAGRSNSAALRSLAQDALANSAATLEMGGSIDEATGKVQVGRDAFIAAATQMGLTGDEAKRLADKYGLIPENVATNVTVTGVDDANGKVSRLVSLIDQVRAMNGTMATVGVRYVVEGRLPNGGVSYGGGSTAADGGVFSLAQGRLVKAYASGGIASIGAQQPQIRPAGGAGILWAEDGAGPWEGFVSGHPAKRGRSRSISEDIVGRLGGTVLWGQPRAFADGALMARPSSRSVASSAPALDPRALASAVSAALDGSRLELTGVDRITGHMSARLVGAIGRV